MVKSAINQFDTVPGNNTDVDGVGVGTSMTVDNTNDAFQHLMALIAQQMGEVGALSADIASAATTDLSTARGWFVNITGTNTISSLGSVPGGKIFRLRFVNGLTLTYNAVSMILPNATNFAAAAGDIVTMLSLGTGNWRFVDYSPAGGGALPAGSIVDFGGTMAPTGWLLCNGQLISRTGYPLLFAAIGTAYSAGDGSTTFGVPDFRGRVAVGNDTLGTSASGRITTSIFSSVANGGTGGAQTVALSIAQMPAHDHNGVTGNQSVNHTHIFADSEAAHTHVQTVGANSISISASALGIDYAVAGMNDTTTGSHATSISGTTATQVPANHTHIIPSEGTGAAISNMPPAIIIAKIIKT